MGTSILTFGGNVGHGKQVMSQEFQVVSSTVTFKFEYSWSEVDNYRRPCTVSILLHATNGESWYQEKSFDFPPDKHGEGILVFFKPPRSGTYEMRLEASNGICFVAGTIYDGTQT